MNAGGIAPPLAGGGAQGGRRRPWRVVRLLAVCAALVAGMVVGPVSEASATGCHWYSPACGKVVNNSPFGLYYDKNLNGSGNSSRCLVWNGDGGSGAHQVNWSCTPRYLSPGSSAGGKIPNVDVDAFSFLDRPYYVVFQGGPTLLVQAGFWTRIHDTETATCQPYVSSAPRCAIWFSG